MSQRKFSPILILVGVLALAVLAWMVSQLFGPSAREGAEPESPIATATTGEQDPDSTEALDAASPDALEVLEEAGASADERREIEGAVELGSLDPYATSWLAGRLVWPEGTPEDEQVYVISLAEPASLRDLYGGRALADKAWDPEAQDDDLLARAQVEPGGTFRIAIPREAAQVHLAVCGRYLYSNASTSFQLPLEQVTLVAELGAWISGKLLAPPDASAEEQELAEIEVEMGPDITAGLNVDRIASLPGERQVETQADGSFEFRGVSDLGVYGIAVRHDHLAAHLRGRLDPAPGEHMQLEVQMLRGATLRGRIVDEAGGGIAEASVEALYRGVVGEGVGALRRTTSAEDGAFELANVAVGDLELRARCDEFQETRQALEQTLLDGSVHEGIVLVLERGGTISGRVLFPGGEPAVNASVRAGFDISQMRTGMEGMEAARVRGGFDSSEADGSFSIAGLRDSTFVVRARLQVEEGERKGEWVATRNAVKTDLEPLELVLEKLVSVHGRVVDLEKKPLSSFLVKAKLQGSGAFLGIGAEQRERPFEEREDGSFELTGLRRGTWELTVDADGYALSELQEVEVPDGAGGEPLLFVLGPSAGVRGVVLDPARNPIPGARVTLELELQEMIDARVSGGSPEAFADSDGLFHLADLDPGALNIVASADGFAASEPLACELLPGELLEDVVLELRVGGTLTGEVLDKDGEPDPNKMVTVQQPPGRRQQIMQTEADGTFRVENLEPGKWQVVVTANFFSGEFGADGDDAATMEALLDSMKIEFVEIFEGETTHVILGQPPADPVTVRGRVEHDGEPLEQTMVSFIPEDAAGLSALKMKVTDDAGQFEIELDHPGAYLVTVQNQVGVGTQSNVEFFEVIPEDAREHELLLKLPGARISGRVMDADGEPIADCRVTLTVEGGVAYGSFLGGNYTETTTDEDGAYDIQYLRPGTYSVAAGGSVLGGMLGGRSEGGRLIQSGLRLEEGGWLESVDFHLGPPCDLVGYVRDVSGSPVADATIFVRDEQGKLLEIFSMVTSDGSGRFVYEGVSPGRYDVTAILGSLVSEPTDPVTVSERDSEEAEVLLVQGTVLRVSVVDNSDAAVQSSLSVTDERGREVGIMRSMEEIMEQFGRGFSSKEHRVGPLPPGRYTVVVTAEDGREGKKPVSLSGQEERKLKIRLK
jgi:uncharacterized GH25 family protein